MSGPSRRPPPPDGPGEHVRTSDSTINRSSRSPNSTSACESLPTQTCGVSGGLDLRPQQHRADNVAPIGHLNASEIGNSFPLAALGRTPFGRGHVKLQWETKPPGVAIDGTGLGEGIYWFPAGTTDAELIELVSRLSPGMLHH
jgi:hypothetical protein